ncbi:MAG: MBL fold metallo-hydrolase [Lachnospirales bacterium]
MEIFKPLISSSSGNATFISSGNTNILIDAGTAGKKIENLLSDINISAEDLDAIFVTHEHMDHISGVGVLSRKYNLPIFATEDTWKYIDKHNKIGKINDSNKMTIYQEEKFTFNDMMLLPFGVSHDASDTVGYNIFMNNRKYTVTTDIGIATDNLANKLSGSHAILIESNHDIDMLNNGSYPDYLKNRILSNTGHLSNIATGNLLTKIDTSNLEQVYLAHLSEENNNPRLALNTVTSIFKKYIKKKVDFFLA